MKSFILILLLPLAAISTVKSELQINLTNVTAGEVTHPHQLATQQPPTLEQLKIHGINTMATMSVDSNTQEKKRSSTSSLHTRQTRTSTARSINTETVPTLTSPSGTTIKFNVWKSVTVLLTSQNSKPINNSTEPITLSNIPQSHSIGKTSTSHKINEVTSSFTSISKQTDIPMETTSIKLEEKISTSSKPVPDDNRPQTSTLGTSAVNYINKAKKNDSQHGKVVAAVIGSALSVMIAGFLIICIKKQRLNKEQTTTHWAGPSPLLDGEANNGNVELQSSKQISITSFLPQRLSKRFSLLPEINEMKNITPGATIEEKRQESTFGEGMDGNYAPEKMFTTAVPDMKTGSEAEEMTIISVAQNSLAN